MEHTEHGHPKDSSLAITAKTRHTYGEQACSPRRLRALGRRQWPDSLSQVRTIGWQHGEWSQRQPRRFGRTFLRPESCDCVLGAAIFVSCVSSTNKSKTPT
jgi:hypothetical protein